MAVSELILPWDTSPVSRTREPEASILETLRSLAYADADVTARAESLFLFLRKVATQVTAKEYLMGIQHLAVSGDPAGARLLAAFVDVSSPGDRLLPRVRGMSSSRRLKYLMDRNEKGQAEIHEDWLRRLLELGDRCQVMIPNDGAVPAPDLPVPGQESPWPCLRDTMELLLARLSLGDAFEFEERQLLVELLRLEVDAWQERISNLAGSIDPYGVAAISRVLPILSIADAEIRDLRQMVTSIAEGGEGADFSRPLSRSLDVLEDNDRAALRKALTKDPDLAPMAEIFVGLADHPVRVPVLAHCIERLQGLASRLEMLGIPDVALDLVSGIRLVQNHWTAGKDESEFLLPLTPGFPEACAGIMEVAATGMGMEAAGLEGMSMRDDHLVIAIPEGGAYPRHDLPAMVEVSEAGDEIDEVMAWADELGSEPETPTEDEEKIDLNSATVTELKHLVLTNIQSVSVLLGFLRNPKVVAIPGLVEEVVHRTRNPIVLETISKVRILHTGFANRSVPLACLRSPVNIPIATLRKFIHVKFISKVDLRRLALDKTGIRKEVGRAITDYLNTLA